MKVWTTGLFGALVLAVLSGCGTNASVTGMVTANGETVNGGSVVFRPMQDGVKPAIGKIGTNGDYALVTAGNEGVTPGEYQVLYMPPRQEEDIQGRPIGAPIKWRKFRAPSETINVESGENDIPISLEKG